MPTTRDIYTSANFLIQQHGVAGAREFAIKRAEQLAFRDNRGAKVMLEISHAINELAKDEGVRH